MGSMYRLYNEVEVYTWFYTPRAAGPEVYKPRIERTEEHASHKFEQLLSKTDGAEPLSQITYFMTRIEVRYV